jgi:hypothetical protein
VIPSIAKSARLPAYGFSITNSRANQDF